MLNHRSISELQKEQWVLGSWRAAYTQRKVWGESASQGEMVAAIDPPLWNPWKQEDKN